MYVYVVVSDIENYVDCCPDCHLSLSVLCVVVVAHVHSCCFSIIGVNDYYIQLLHSCCFSVIVVMCLSVVICNAYKRPLYVVHTPIVI